MTTDGKPITQPPPMICYFCGFWQGSGTQYFLNGSCTGFHNASRCFKCVGPLTPRGRQSNDLSFGVERPLFGIEVNPRDTLYIRFWANYVKELYSPSARIVKCQIRFDDKDFAQFDFSNTIFLRNAEYRVLDLSFDANAPSVARVTLILRLSDTALCLDEPTSYVSSSNTILFNNSTSGSPDYGSETCCTFYGYVWDENTSGDRCRPNTQQLDI